MLGVPGCGHQYSGLFSAVVALRVKVWRKSSILTLAVAQSIKSAADAAKLQDLRSSEARAPLSEAAIFAVNFDDHKPSERIQKLPPGEKKANCLETEL